MINIFLIRHGEQIPQRGDLGLTDKGIRQASQTAKFLLNYKIDTIVSSPSKRCTQTAEYFSQILNLPLSIDKRLKERIDFEEVPNLSFKDYLSLCYRSTIDRDFILPNNETSKSSGKRLEGFINEVLKKGSFKCICVVAHQGIISDYLRNVFFFEILKKYSSRYSDNYCLENCSLTHLVIEKGKINIKKLNSIKHIES